jgi:hypothetical protein
MGEGEEQLVDQAGPRWASTSPLATFSPPPRLRRLKDLLGLNSKDKLEWSTRMVKDRNRRIKYTIELYN